MKKTELIKLIADDAHLSMEDVEYSLDTFIDTTKEALKDGKQVPKMDYGTFSFEAENIQNEPGILGDGATTPFKIIVKLDLGDDDLGPMTLDWIPPPW